MGGCRGLSEMSGAVGRTQDVCFSDGDDDGELGSARIETAPPEESGQLRSKRTPLPSLPDSETARAASGSQYAHAAPGMPGLAGPLGLTLDVV